MARIKRREKGLKILADHESDPKNDGKAMTRVAFGRKYNAGYTSLTEAEKKHQLSDVIDKLKSDGSLVKYKDGKTTMLCSKEYADKNGKVNTPKKPRKVSVDLTVVEIASTFINRGMRMMAG